MVVRNEMNGDETTKRRRIGGGSVSNTSVGEALAPSEARAVAEVELGYIVFASATDEAEAAAEEGSVLLLLFRPFLRGVVEESSGCVAVADDDEVVGPGGPLAGPGMLRDGGGSRRALIL